MGVFRMTYEAGDVEAVRKKGLFCEREAGKPESVRKMPPFCERDEGGEQKISPAGEKSISAGAACLLFDRWG